MANGNIQIEVSAESIAHRALIEALQEIYDQYGICVHDLTARWIDESTPDKPFVRVTEVELRTSARVIPK